MAKLLLDFLVVEDVQDTQERIEEEYLRDKPDFLGPIEKLVKSHYGSDASVEVRVTAAPSVDDAISKWTIKKREYQTMGGDYIGYCPCAIVDFDLESPATGLDFARRITTAGDQNILYMVLLTGRRAAADDRIRKMGTSYENLGLRGVFMKSDSPEALWNSIIGHTKYRIEELKKGSAPYTNSQA